MQSIEQFYPILNQPFKAVITSHQKPDGDAMGSSLGLYHFLKQLGHEVTVISPTNWASFLDWMPGSDEVIDFEANKEKANSIIQAADYVFLLFNTMRVHIGSSLREGASIYCIPLLYATASIAL